MMMMLDLREAATSVMLQGLAAMEPYIVACYYIGFQGLARQPNVLTNGIGEE